MTDTTRIPTRRYQDPLARVWLACAERLGFRVRRTKDAYACSDGKGRLWIADDSQLDPDDSLAQMIFHELCHALVEGDAGETRQDWGLGYTVGNNPWREHACLRLQAYLAGGVGLRDFFAPTTDFRVTFWNNLPANPFASLAAGADGRREKSCVAARIGAWRATLPRWQPLRQALAASAAIAAVTPSQLDYDSGAESLPSLWRDAVPPPEQHPADHAPVAGCFPGHDCADCAWHFSDGPNHHCRHAVQITLPGAVPACVRWEPSAELDCLTCGACCREAYDAIEVADDDPVNSLHPELVVTDGKRRKLRRVGPRCAALSGGHNAHERYGCIIYPDRPQTCRDFTIASGHCLDARRRLGLSL